MNMVIYQLLTDSVANQQHCQEMALLDLPGLEFINVAQVRIKETPCSILYVKQMCCFAQLMVAFLLVQGENSYPFEALMNKDPVSFGNWDQQWMNNASANEESKLIQNGPEESSKVSTYISST